MDASNKVAAYRLVGYAATTFSTVAVLSIAITLPMVYNYAAQMRRTTLNDLKECKVLNQTYFEQECCNFGLCIIASSIDF